MRNMKKMIWNQTWRIQNQVMDIQSKDVRWTPKKGKMNKNNNKKPTVEETAIDEN